MVIRPQFHFNNSQYAASFASMPIMFQQSRMMQVTI